MIWFLLPSLLKIRGRLKFRAYFSNGCEDLVPPFSWISNWKKIAEKNSPPKPARNPKLTTGLICTGLGGLCDRHQPEETVADIQLKKQRKDAAPPSLNVKPPERCRTSFFAPSSPSPSPRDNAAPLSLATIRHLVKMASQIREKQGSL